MHATPPRRTACSAATSTGRSPSRSRPRNREWHSTSVAARARTRFGLARAGWEVTALDISTVAVERGSAAAEAAGVSVRWVATDFAAEDLGQFDFVTAHYPALKHTPDRAVLRALVAAVASGGTLLYVGHAPLDREFSLARGFDPNDYVLPSTSRRSSTTPGTSRSPSSARGPGERRTGRRSRTTTSCAPAACANSRRRARRQPRKLLLLDGRSTSGGRAGEPSRSHQATAATRPLTRWCRYA